MKPWRSAIEGAACAALIACAMIPSPARAGDAGEVTHLSGTLAVQRPDGTLLVLGVKSTVAEGDLLTTQRDSYAQINFIDGSSITLRPYSQLRVEAFSYVQEKPQTDNVFLRLLRGGLRTVTGLVGKRGTQDAYRIGTATATIGIRGSVGDTLYCSPNCAGVVPGGEKLPPATYHQTLSGIFVMESGGQTAVINEGFSASANGSEVKVVTGGIGGGQINFFVPLGGNGLKGPICGGGGD